MKDRNKTVNDINFSRKKYWATNLFRKFLIHKKDKRIWIFSSLNGKYQDNSMYLFEYVSKNCPEVKPYYFVGTEQAKKDLDNKGLNSVVIGTKEAKKLQKKAGISFYTHGIDDFGPVVRNYRSYVVALWHGVGFKKMYYSDPTFKDNIIKKIYRSAFSYTHRDLTVTTSKYCFDCFAADFRFRKNAKYVIIGQPRNDGLVANKDKKPSGKKIILYAPTYRRFEKENVNIQSVVDMFSDKAIQDKLTKLGYVVYIKLHPITTGIEIKESENVVNASKFESQKLLESVDTLITDYSSIASDFAITGRKIIFYAPDYDEYTKYEPVFEESDEIYKGPLVCKTPDEILKQIEGNDLSLTDKINNLFNTSLEGNYSSRIVQYLYKELKIK